MVSDVVVVAVRQVTDTADQRFIVKYHLVVFSKLLARMRNRLPLYLPILLAY